MCASDSDLSKIVPGAFLPYLYAMRPLTFIMSVIIFAAAQGQMLPPKQAYPFTVKQIHSGHSLTDPLFYPNWPGQYVNLMATVTGQSAWQLIDRVIGKSTIPAPASQRMSIRIHDVTGTHVTSSSIPQGASSATINISPLPPGLYAITAASDSTTQTTMVVKR